MKLRNASIATSGSYQRYYAVNGVRHSHIIDPRSGRPADAIASATVIAADSTTANALATILCVLTPLEGLKLLGELAGAAGLIVTADGEQFRTPNFIRFEDPKPAVKKDEKKDEKIVAWPDDYEVKINLELPTPTGTRPRRPYVAIWIEDGDGKAIRTVAVWGNSPKWINTLSGWWKIGKDDKDLVKAVSRATRAPGKYEIAWDGKNDAGKAVGQGTYTVKIEVHREHGKDVTQTGKIECLKEAAKLKLEKNAETEETTVAFAKKEKKDKK